MLNVSHRETKQAAAVRLLRSGDHTVRRVSQIIGCSVRTAFRAQHEIRAIEGESRLDRVETRLRALETRVDGLAASGH